MEILITGGNGFLGRNLILALQERGDTARVLALPAENTSWLEERGVQVFRGDLRDPQVLQAPMQGVDKVVHLAAMMGTWRSVAEYAAVNVKGTIGETGRSGCSDRLHIWPMALPSSRPIDEPGKSSCTAWEVKGFGHESLSEQDIQSRLELASVM